MSQQKPILSKETAEFFARLQRALPHSGKVSFTFPEFDIGDPLEIDMKLRAATKATSGLHRAYFGDKGFARRVYEMQLGHSAGMIAGINARHRASKQIRPNVSQRVLEARAQAEKEV